MIQPRLVRLDGVRSDIGRASVRGPVPQVDDPAVVELGLVAAESLGDVVVPVPGDEPEVALRVEPTAVVLGEALARVPRLGQVAPLPERPQPARAGRPAVERVERRALPGRRNPREVLAVQGIGRLPAGHNDVSFVKLEPHGAADARLRRIDERVERLAQRTEPLAVVHQLGVLPGQNVFVVKRGPVQCQALQLPVRRKKEASPGSLVDAARLYAHEPILHEIHATHAVDPSDPVQGLDQLHRPQGFPVYRNGNSFVQLDLQVSGSVRRSFRSHAEDKHLFPRLVPRVFENSSLMAEVPQVPVFAVDLLPGGGDGNLAGVSVIDFVFARSDVPFPPGGNDFQLRIESLVGELEPDLIVAFPGAAVGHRIRSFLFGDFDLAARDQRARE